MELKKLSSRIYYLPNEEETDRPVLGYINGDKYSLAVDAGNSRRHVEKFYEELRNENLRLPDYTVITHWHWDHTFGMHAVSGKTVSGRRTNEKLKEVAAWQWTDEATKARLDTGKDIELCDRCIKLEYPDRNDIKVITSDIEFSGTLKLDLGGIYCEITEVRAPHSEDSVLIFVPDERTVFVGDADCEDHYNNHGRYDKAELERYIELIKDYNFNTYVIGHDKPESREEVLDYLDGELEKIK
ncbi:MAG: MBL fold metallo-hydrolase [Bacillota bacterium]|nr:MBL fold metallo-hydrolase [Bacillota bacterium]